MSRPRLLFVVAVVLMSVLMTTLERRGRERQAEAEAEAEAAAMPPLEQVREQAYELHRKSQWPQAIASYDALLRKSPRDADALYWRGIAKWKLARDDEALEDFRAVVALEPGNYDANLNADRILSRQRRYAECVDLWNVYLRVVPRDANGFAERGGSYFHLGEYPRAHADATRACEMGHAKSCVFAERMKETVLQLK